MDDDLRRELMARADADQRARRSLPEEHTVDQWQQVVAPVDAANLEWIRDVIGRWGWPGASLVGCDGAHAAWLLVQHAPLDLQERCLPLLTKAVEEDEASPADHAYLLDRVRMRRDQKQIFGTQFEQHGEVIRPWPIDDPDTLDERRASVGLPPYADCDLSQSP